MFTKKIKANNISVINASIGFHRIRCYNCRNLLATCKSTLKKDMLRKRSIISSKKGQNHMRVVTDWFGAAILY
jgi:hypothetical protein